MPPRYSRIFLLSHMRAYTSLLGHLLGSHPQINGYYEMHQSYACAEDLEKQAREFALRESLKPHSRFLFDKLLHNDYALQLERLDPDSTFVLVALRPPQPTLKSIVDLFARRQAADPYADPAGAASYYIERLRALAAFAQRYPGRFHYFDADLLRSDTARVLAACEQWLQLDSPLTERYQTFSQTGVAGAGDSSPAIAAGRVIRRENAYPDVALDGEALQRAELAYRTCRQQLVDRAAAALTL